MSSIKLQGVCLDYIVKTGTTSIRKSTVHLLNRWIKQPRTESFFLKNTSYRALNNINLVINKRDRVGILGRNGAGKSTLLKVIGKVYQPSNGRLEIKGKIFNLFDVNLGMNVEATGYENIINLSIMRGISKKEAYRMTDEIEAFTELGPYLNSPVRTYSAGMQMKLAFAVATSVSADIMLVDEIIGVGDTHFVERATQRLENRVEQSHILILASHSSEIIRRFCNKALVLDKGEVQFFGGVEEGIALYESEVA